jgi:hypothetical protein
MNNINMYSYIEFNDSYYDDFTDKDISSCRTQLVDTFSMTNKTRRDATAESMFQRCPASVIGRILLTTFNVRISKSMISPLMRWIITVLATHCRHKYSMLVWWSVFYQKWDLLMRIFRCCPTSAFAPTLDGIIPTWTSVFEMAILETYQNSAINTTIPPHVFKWMHLMAPHIGLSYIIRNIAGNDMPLNIRNPMVNTMCTSYILCAYA